MFKLLYCSSTTACFELINNEIYYAKKPYCVFVNGQIAIKDRKENVFSLFGLTPDTEYAVKTSNDDFEYKFKTKSESCCLSVVDFGAKGDGKTLDTRAIQSAIFAAKPNGRIYIPPGIYYTGPIILKSDITIELAKGAKLLASADVNDYPIWPGEAQDLSNNDTLLFSVWEGEPKNCYQSFISAYNCANIHIVGQGEIDGNGPNGIWYHDVKNQKIGRPRLCFFCNCNGVYMHGVTAGHSASWNIHSFFSANIGIYDIKVVADKDSPNTDGCNPESCENVEIIGASFSVGDDCIALKSGKIYIAQKYKKPCRKITVRNCLMQYGHGALVLGSEMSGGIKEFSVTQCLFHKTDRGLRIKTRRGRGKDAIIDNVLFENIKMVNVLTPLVINMYYFCDPDGKTDFVQNKEPGKYPLDETTPYLGSFTFKNIECIDCEYAAGHFWGLPEQPIDRITIEDVTFAMKKDAGAGETVMMTGARKSHKEGLYFFNVNNVVLKNLTFSGIKGQSVVADRVKSIEQHNVKVI
jgi:polygalacturonase